MVHNPAHDLFSIGNFLCRVTKRHQSVQISKSFGLQPVTSRLPMSQGWALSIFGSKGQGHIAWITENDFRHIAAYPLHLCSLNFTCRLPMSQGLALSTLGSKVQGHNAWITENGFWHITAYPSCISP